MKVSNAIVVYSQVASVQKSHAWKTWAKLYGELWGDREVTSITAGEINAHIAERRAAGKSEATIRSMLNTLRQIFATADVSLPPRVAKTKKCNERVRTFEGNEEQRIKAVMEQQHWAVVEAAALTGLRGMELFNLRQCEVNFAGGYLYVSNAPGNKTGARRVLLGPKAKKALKWLIDDSQKRGCCDYVVNPPGFTSFRQRRSLMAAWKERVWRPALRVAKVQDFHFHDLRHVTASRIVCAGHSLYNVEKVLGVSPNIARRYAHLNDKALRTAVSCL